MDESVKEEIKRIPLSVDIVSDVVCPWCIVGYKQFEKALATKP
ncbi:MAG: putative DsbA family dithiol-disulfide isomerase, partial [Halieaceae bacterium]